MDLFDKTGKMAIGSRLRMLTDRITTDAAGIYQLYGVDIKPKWFPVLYALSGGEEKQSRVLRKRSDRPIRP